MGRNIRKKHSRFFFNWSSWNERLDFFHESLHWHFFPLNVALKVIFCLASNFWLGENAENAIYWYFSPCLKPHFSKSRSDFFDYGLSCHFFYNWKDLEQENIRYNFMHGSLDMAKARKIAILKISSFSKAYILRIWTWFLLSKPCPRAFH